MIEVQKALHLFQETDKKSPKYAGKDYMVFEKHDGWFGYLDFPSCIIHSRAHRQIPSLVELSDAIRDKRPDCKGRLIFEIMIEGLEVDSFHELNGILNRKSEQVDGVYLRVHDYLHEWNTDIPALKRYQFAQEIVNRLDMPSVLLSPVLAFSRDPKQWQAEAEKVWLRGGEGVILKHTQGAYHPAKRNFELMKIKEECTLDLKVVGVNEGQGKYEESTGTITVQDRCGNTHEVSGMTDKQRSEWWQDPSKIIAKVVEVKAMKKLKDGSLREPRFKAIRYDKLISEID